MHSLPSYVLPIINYSLQDQAKHLLSVVTALYHAETQIKSCQEILEYAYHMGMQYLRYNQRLQVPAYREEEVSWLYPILYSLRSVRNIDAKKGWIHGPNIH